MNDLQIYFGVVFIIYCCLFFFDSFFKSCCHYPYIVFLKNTGIKVDLFRVHWFTTALNRVIQKWGTIRPKFLSTWFSVGSIVSVALMPLASLLIITNIIFAIHDLLHEKKSSFSGIILEPVVPGLNLPIEDIFHYVFSLLTCSVVHELGHAVAAAREGVHVSGIGFLLVFIIPVVYTQLDQIDNLPAVKQLRILCAGVWHNLIFALSAAFVVLALPYLFSPIYHIGQSVGVETILKDSFLLGPSGLSVGDEITKINHCPVYSSRTWKECITYSARSLSPGYCVSADFIHQQDESYEVRHMSDGTIDCCKANSTQNLCFEYLESESEPIELPQHSCLHARKVAENFDKPCYSSHECAGLHCFRPLLNNVTKLIQINRLKKPIVLFVGHPAEIFRSVKVTEFVQRYILLPPWLPGSIAKFCSYLSVFSGGLVVLNIIPCFYFDGYHITYVLVQMIWHKTPYSSVRLAITMCITILGSFVLILYLVLNLIILTTT